MTETWRLLRDPADSGAWNMAVDEAILGGVGAGKSLPTLRVYAWEPACLSLGYAQPLTDADPDQLTARGWDIVRRMTGGRAILHTDEVTYSVTLPAAHPLAAGSIVDSYRRLSAALLDALDAIGLAAHADKRTEAAVKRPGPVCFEIPSDYEITAGGKKLIGSAQVRKQGAILQHGSLPLTGDLSRICEALSFPDEDARREARSRVLTRATTLENAIGQSVTWQVAADALINAFAARFDVQFSASVLSAVESARAAELRDTRYGAPLKNP